MFPRCPESSHSSDTMMCDTLTKQRTLFDPRCRGTIGTKSALAGTNLGQRAGSSNQSSSLQQQHDISHSSSRHGMSKKTSKMLPCSFSELRPLFSETVLHSSLAFSFFSISDVVDPREQWLHEKIIKNGKGKSIQARVVRARFSQRCTQNWLFMAGKVKMRAPPFSHFGC